jgi:hypothetical protein
MASSGPGRSRRFQELFSATSGPKRNEPLRVPISAVPRTGGSSFFDSGAGSATGTSKDGYFTTYPMPSVADQVGARAATRRYAPQSAVGSLVYERDRDRERGGAAASRKRLPRLKMRTLAIVPQ